MKQVKRLYQQFKPNHYDLNIKLDKDNKKFYGQVIINGLADRKTKKISLHSKDLAIEYIRANSSLCKFNVTGDELEILLPTEHTDQITIDIKYSADIKPNMQGIYPCTGRYGETIIATQFESHFARQAFPCVDEPQAKATFKMTITGPKTDVFLSNTTLESERINGQNKTVTFKETPLMSTYLLAFVVGPLKSKHAKTKQGVLVSAYSTEDLIDNTNFALEVGVKSIEFFVDYFGVDYPLDKCDLVALPDFAAGAMENWGLITFRESCLLVDPKNTSLDLKQFVAIIIAHEITHHWFGNLVTMEWWNDLWLNEGFASWGGFLAVNHMFPDWHMWSHFLAAEQCTALRLDALKNTHPIEVEINDPDEIIVIFDAISYEKGASVIHMLHDYLGDADFRKGTRQYLKKYSHSNTQTEHLWQELEEATGKPVRKFMSAWTSQPGYPLVNVSKDGQNIKLVQKRFISDGSNFGDELWPVPLLSSKTNMPTLDNQEVIISCNKISDFRLNENQTGFYITNYLPEQYKSIEKEILNLTAPEVNRLRYIYDALLLVKSGDLDVKILLDLLDSFNNETSASVWDIIALAISGLRQIMGEDVVEAIKPFVVNISSKQAARLDWQESTDESHFDTLLRPIVLSLAASGDDKDTVSKIYDVFNNSPKVDDLPANLKNTILLAISKRGGKADYAKILNMLDDHPSPEDKISLLHALYNFRGKDEIKRSLDLLKSSHIKLQDIGYCISFIFANPKAKTVGWKWLQKNWAWVKESLTGDIAFTRIPMFVARAQSDTGFLSEYNEFFTKVSEPLLERAIKQGQETIIAQSNWRKRDHDKILAWLKQNYPG